MPSVQKSTFKISAEANLTLPNITSEVSVMSLDQAQTLTLINDHCKERGLPPLKFSPQLSKLAENYAKNMYKRNFFSPVNPEGQSPFECMKKRKIVYHYAVENLPFNVSVCSAQQTFMGSPSHKANILNANFAQVSIGLVEVASERVFVVQEFIVD